MHVMIGLAIFVLPGLLLAVAVRNDKRPLVGSAALALTGSIAVLSLAGFILVRFSVYSGVTTWLMAVGVTAGAVVISFVPADQKNRFTTPRLPGVALLLPAVLMGAIRWSTYAAGDRFARGWDAGINTAFLANLQRTGSFPATQLGEIGGGYYYQGIFFAVDALRRPQMVPFAEVKIFSAVAVVALVLSATWLVVAVLGSDHRPFVGSAIAGVAFGTFLISSAHTAMMVGLAVGLALVALSLEMTDVEGSRTSRLIAAVMLGFAVVAVHPPSVQIVGLGIVGLTLGLLFDDDNRWKRALVPVAVFTGSVVAGVTVHSVLAPALTRAEVTYAVAQSSAIDSGNLQINAAVAAGAVRSSIQDLLLWLIPPLAAPFVVLGLGIAVVRSRLAVIGLGTGLAVAAFVKVSPTNGREYMILFVPLMLLFTIAVERLTRLSGQRAARIGLFIVLAVVASTAVLRAVQVGTSPAVGRTAYIDDRTIAEADLLGANLDAGAVLAVRYRPETLLIQGKTGIVAVGGYSELGSAASLTDIDALLDDGPTSGDAHAIACRYGITHVYVLRSDPTYAQWVEAPGRIETPGGVLVAVGECGGGRDG